MRVFLHSGGGLLDDLPALRSFLGGLSHLVFVPYALDDVASYTEAIRGHLAPHGLEVEGLHESADPLRRLQTADALLMGGGNTFRLLNRLYELDALSTIRARVREGMLYVGSSAGSNVACPTIMTTNDMPIVCPPSFGALGLVPFQINPHYLDPDPESTHRGETRETRIREFHEMNEIPVLGLRETSAIERNGDSLTLHGPACSRLFRRGRDPLELDPGAPVDFLLDGDRS